MKLNKLEFFAMNSRIRALIQESYEVRIMRSMTKMKHPGNVLEIGCGNGHGSRLIRKYFSPEKIFAVDSDERMINKAVINNKDPGTIFRLMDAAALDFPDKYFDAVFDFAIIHHIPEWKDCLEELKRVLKPGGELILEELSIDSFTKGMGKLWKILSDHPYEHMYTPGEFTGFLEKTGFEILSYKEYNPLRFVKFFSLNALSLPVS